jgi:MFS family permease
MHASAPPSRVATEAAFAALLLGMLAAQLDGTITVAALPVIGAELGSPTGIAGIAAAYLLTVSVSTPLWGAMGDQRGRRAVFAAAVVLFAAGSLLCAVAPSLPLLIAARAVQGVGGSGLIVSAVTVLGEMFDHHERIRRQGWLTGVFAVSSLAGPPLGGFLATGPGWRWIFLVNLPICAVALALGVRAVPARGGSGPAGFDVCGAALLVVGGTAAVGLGSFDALATGGWAPPLAAVVIVSAVAFVSVERGATVPLIPPRLFDVPALARSIVVTGLTGAALFGTFPFVPLTVAAGVGSGTVTTSGLLLALTGGQLLAITAFAVLARRRPRMTPWGRLSLVTGAAGLGILALVPQLRAWPAPAAAGIAVAGLGLSGAALGLSMQAYTLLAQRTAPPDRIGSAMATLTFVRQFSGVLGAAGYGWLLLVVPGPAGLTVLLTVAAFMVAAGLLVGPRDRDEP